MRIRWLAVAGVAVVVVTASGLRLEAAPPAAGARADEGPRSPAPASQAVPKEPGGESLLHKGTVVDEETGKPIAGVTVVVRRSTRGPGQGRVIHETRHTTGADGSFSFSVPPEQSADLQFGLELEVEHPGQGSRARLGPAAGATLKGERPNGRPSLEAVGMRPVVRVEAPAGAHAAAGRGATAAAVDRLVGLIRRNPPKLSEAEFRRGLYLLDLETGEVNLVADEPDPGLSNCGSPDWSPDGRFLVFDVMPPGGSRFFHLTRIKKVEADGDGLAVKDLGRGNVPGVTPEGDRVVFLLNPGAVAGAEPGLYFMQADGTRRVRLGEFARPKVSPDGSRILLIAYSTPQRLSILELATGKAAPFDLGDTRIFSTPTWAGPNKLIAVTGTDAPDTLAMIDFANPDEVKSEPLFSLGAGGRGGELGAPLYRPDTGRSIFVVSGPKGRAMLSIAGGWETLTVVHPLIRESMTDPALSPDGRYVLFSSTRRAPRWTTRGLDPRPSEATPAGLPK